MILGPQRFQVTAGHTVASLGVEGHIATITAGWEEREDDDGELNEVMSGRATNLRLYHRFLDVLTKDTRFAAAGLEFRDRQDELLDFYRLRLTHALAAVTAVQRRTSRQGIGPTAIEDAVEAVRALDRWYLAELHQLLAEFDDGSGHGESETIAWHRGEIEAVLAGAGAVAIAGGNVATLLRALWLFDCAVPLDKPVVAWSAGAMVLTDSVILFHDFSPQGSGAAEVYAPGLGRLPGIVALPHARRRLALDDHPRTAVLARRFCDHSLVLLDDGTRLQFPTGGGLPGGARVLTADGEISEVRQ